MLSSPRKAGGREGRKKGKKEEKGIILMGTVVYFVSSNRWKGQRGIRSELQPISNEESKCDGPAKAFFFPAV